MPQLLCKVQNKIAKPMNDLLVCGNSDFTIKFIFDNEWENETVKTARFIWNNQYQDIVFSGNICNVPIVSKADYLAVGVFAGELKTTTPAIYNCRRSILCEFAEPEAPSEDVYAQIIDLINQGVSADITNQVNELKVWVYEQTQTQRETIRLTEDDTALEYEFLQKNNREYYFTGGTVKTIFFENLVEEVALSDDYWTLFVFPKADSVGTPTDLILNSEIKLINPELDLSSNAVVHLLFTFDGENICCIAAGY